MRKPKKRNILFLLVILAAVVSLTFLFRAFIFSRGRVAGLEDEKKLPAKEELAKKFGSNFQYSVSESTGAVTFLKSKEGKIPLVMEKLMGANDFLIAQYFMQEYGRYFGLSKPLQELKLVGKSKDKEGMTHIRFNQKYEEIPVYGAQAIVHLEKDRSVVSTSAKFLPSIKVGTKPKISRRKAEKIAKFFWKEQKGVENPKTGKTRLYIYDKGFVQNKARTGDRLVWVVEVFSKVATGRGYFFLDAASGELLNFLPAVRDINRRAYDGNSGAHVLSRLEGQGAVGVSDVDNMYDILGGVHNYYSTKFGRNGANNQGGLGDGYTNAYTNTDAYTRIDNVPGNAYECPRAYYDYYSIKFCSGEAVTDIAGHEYTHGVIYFSIPDAYGQPWGFNYEGESGALEEAYASIFGETVENYIKGSADWQLGEDSSVPGYESVSFSLSNPGSIDVGYGPYPAKLSDSGFYCGSDDYGGVHQNSSVLAHAAYLMAAGGDYNGYSIGSIGIDAMENIFYRALANYLTISSDFESSYTALNTACNDFYGEGSFSCAEAKKALQAVEFDQLSPCEEGSQKQIVSDVTELPYNAKKSAKRRIKLTVSSLEISKKKWVKVRIGGRKAKVVSVRTSGGSTTIAVNFKYRKMPRGSYGAVVSYKKKIGRSWQRGTVSEDNVLSII